MRSIKILGVAAVAAMALMAFAGTPSATTLTSPAGTVYKEAVKATAESSLILQASFFEVTCTESEVKGAPGAQNDTTTVTIPIAILKFGGCNTLVRVLANGSLEIHVIGAGPNGTVTGMNTKVTFEALGFSCVYGTAAGGTDLGILTGSGGLGGATATMDINANLPRIEGGFPCPANALWEGKYKITEPDYLDIS